jgi:hypothetical protein
MDSLEPRWASVLNRPKLGFVAAQAAAAPPKPATIRATTAGRHVRSPCGNCEAQPSPSSNSPRSKSGSRPQPRQGSANPSDQCSPGSGRRAHSLQLT